MSRQNNHDKPKYSDPLYTGEKYPPNFMNMSLSKMYGGLCLLVTALIVKEIGWAAATAFAAAMIGFWILLKILRRQRILKASVSGYINRYNQTTRQCITPDWKYDQCFYKLECRDCGHIQDVRADKIHKRKCPVCKK